MNKRCPKCKIQVLELEEEIKAGLCYLCIIDNEGAVVDLPPTKTQTKYYNEITPSVFEFEQEKNLETPNERVTISSKLWAKIQAYCQAASGEVSGIGKIKKVDGGFEVEDIILLPQEASSGFTRISAETISKFMLDKVRVRESLDGWRIWWHTHNDFSCFWSGIDISNIKDMLGQMSEDGYLISIETNKHGDVIARYDEDTTTKPLHVSILPSKEFPHTESKCRKDVEEMVKPYTFQLPKFSSIFRRKDKKYPQSTHYHLD